MARLWTHRQGNARASNHWREQYARVMQLTEACRKRCNAPDGTTTCASWHNSENEDIEPQLAGRRTVLNWKIFSCRATPMPTAT
jgi:hypothetical protein